MNPRLAFSSFSLMLFTIVSSCSAGELVVQPMKCGIGLFVPTDSHCTQGKPPSDNVSGVDCMASEVKGKWNCTAVSDECLSISAFELTPQSNAPWLCTVGKVLDIATDYMGLKNPEAVEYDFEGVTMDVDGLAATGSMSISRKKAKLQPHNWTVFAKPKVGMGKAAERPELLKLFQRISSPPEIAASIDKTLQCGGLNIEGFERIIPNYFFGLRSPSDRSGGKAYIVEVHEDALFGEGETGPEPMVHTVSFSDESGKLIEGIGIRAMDVVGDTFYLITGDAGVEMTEDALAESKKPDEKGCNVIDKEHFPNPPTEQPPRLWSWKIGSPSATLLGVIGSDQIGKKVEGLTMLGTTALIAIDGGSSQLATVSGFDLKN